MGELISIVQTHMDEFGVSEATVARRIGAQPQTVNTWRNGEMKTLPKRGYLEELASLTKRDYAEVLVAALVDIGYLDADTARKLLGPESELEDPRVRLIVELSVATEEINRRMSDDFSADGQTASSGDFLHRLRGFLLDFDRLSQKIYDAAFEVASRDPDRLQQLEEDVRASRQGPLLGRLSQQLEDYLSDHPESAPGSLSARWGPAPSEETGVLGDEDGEDRDKGLSR